MQAGGRLQGCNCFHFFEVLSFVSLLHSSQFAHSEDLDVVFTLSLGVDVADWVVWYHAWMQRRCISHGRECCSSHPHALP